MPAAAIRIGVFLLATTLLVFAYEQHWVSQSKVTTGEIVSIRAKSKGKVVNTRFLLDHQQTTTFAVGIGPVNELFVTYHVGDEVPVRYCQQCDPIAKIAYPLNLYTITSMFALLDLIACLVLFNAWWRLYRSADH